MLLFHTGFDNATTVAKLMAEWETSTSSASMQLATGRTGINALRCVSATYVWSYRFTTSGGFIFGGAFKIVASPDSNRFFLIIREDVTQHLSVVIDTARKIRLYLGDVSDNVLIDTSTDVLLTDKWYYFEMKGTIHNTTGSYEIRIDGSTFGGLSGTNVDTRNGATGTWDNFILGSGTLSNMTVDLDDLYLCDTSSANNNDFLGDTKTYTILPLTDAVSAGSNAAFTPSAGTDHGAMVDETNPNDDTDYNASSTPGNIDTYQYPDQSITGTFRAVTLSAYMKKTDAGARTVSGVTRVAGVNYMTAAINPNTDYRYRQLIFELNPATGARWTDPEVDAAEFGLQITT